MDPRRAARQYSIRTPLTQRRPRLALTKAHYCRSKSRALQQQRCTRPAVYSIYIYNTHCPFKYFVRCLRCATHEKKGHFEKFNFFFGAINYMLLYSHFPFNLSLCSWVFMRVQHLVKNRKDYLLLQLAWLKPRSSLQHAHSSARFIVAADRAPPRRRIESAYSIL